MGRSFVSKEISDILRRLSELELRKKAGDSDFDKDIELLTERLKRAKRKNHERITSKRSLIKKNGEFNDEMSRKRRLTVDLRQILSEELAGASLDFRTARELIVAAIEHAKEGNPAFFKEIMERIHGKEPVRMEHTGAEGGPIKLYASASPDDWPDAIETNAEVLDET